MTEFHPGDLVRIKESSKSQYKGAIATVVSHCNGSRRDILLIQLWRNKTVQICESSLQKLPDTKLPIEDAAMKFKEGFTKGYKKGVEMMRKVLHKKEDKAACSVSIYTVDDVADELLLEVEDEDNG